MMKPLNLPANQPRDRFYQGGARISTFRHDEPSPPHTPEDWVGSTTSVRGKSPIGMTRLSDGTLLADAIEQDPLVWLGQEHVDAFGTDTMLLVKLLDPGQRLPVHAHPDGDFAAQHVSCNHGKAEAWYILAPGVVYLGLQRDISLEELRDIVMAEDSAALLALTHEIPVNAGDTVFVPHGVVHAIGEGVLLAEVQEPEDLSILLEWSDFDLDGHKDGHLGLGFDLALEAVDKTGRTRQEIMQLIRTDGAEGPTLVEEAAHYFRLDLVRASKEFDAGFAIVIALEPGTKLHSQSGSVLDLHSGSTTLIPFDSGTFRLEGGAALVARPPVAR